MQLRLSKTSRVEPEAGLNLRVESEDQPCLPPHQASAAMHAAQSKPSCQQKTMRGLLLWTLARARPRLAFQGCLKLSSSVRGGCLAASLC